MNCLESVVGDPDRKDCLEHLSIYGRIILKLNLEK